MDDDVKTQGQVVDEEDDFDFGNTGDGDGGEGSGDGSGEGNEGEGDGDGKGDGGEGKEGDGDGKTGDDSESGDGEGDAGGTGESSDDEGDGGEAGEGEAGEKKEGEGKEGDGDGEGAEGKEGSESSEGDGSGEGGEDGKGAESKKEGEGEPDFFGEEFKDDGEGQQAETVSYKPLAEKFGLELESDTPQEFEQKLAEKIESSKQEFKIEDYPADAQAIIKHLTTNDGKIEDFFQNDNISSLQGVIGLKPEAKVLYIRTNEFINKGIDPEKAKEQAEEEIENWSTKEVKNQADSIDADARRLINEEIVNVVGNREEIVSKQTEKQKGQDAKELNNLKAYVNSQDEFMGMKLTPKAKQNIVQAIDSGEFDNLTDKSPEASKFRAYMLGKFGKKIAESYSNTASEQNRKGHNAAIDKSTSALHKTKAGAQQKSTGHQQEKSKDKGKFDGFTDDLFDLEAEE